MVRSPLTLAVNYRLLAGAPDGRTIVSYASIPQSRLSSGVLMLLPVVNRTGKRMYIYPPKPATRR